jgi:hypothetical protein
MNVTNVEENRQKNLLTNLYSVLFVGKFQHILIKLLYIYEFQTFKQRKFYLLIFQFSLKGNHQVKFKIFFSN